MATINNMADLVKVLQDNPEWLLTIRGLIISKEIADLPASVEELKATVERMSDTLTTRLDDVSGTLTTVSGRVNNLTGDDYEGQAAHFGRRRLRDALQVEDLQLMYQTRRQGREDLRKLLSQDQAVQRPSKENQDDLEDTDLIFWIYSSDAEGKELVTAHLVAEVSFTIKANDVVRARRRAQILGSCTNLPCLAAVIGTAITPEARSQLADDVTAVGMTQEGHSVALPLAEPEQATEQ
ncbi:MAG: hypothetical protein OXE17_00100 [Chloroflexi bacterium]|nr:hypothetical protein [Chloroflexota bacterium]